MNRRLLQIVAMLVAAASNGYAHHPYGAYDLERETTITGEVVLWSYQEPHTFMHVRTHVGRRDVVWIVEFRGAGGLQAHGITPQTFKAGERVTIRGNPGRVAADRRVRMRSIVRLRDGWRWSDA